MVADAPAPIADKVEGLPARVGEPIIPVDQLFGRRQRQLDPLFRVSNLVDRVPLRRPEDLAHHAQMRDCFRAFSSRPASALLAAVTRSAPK
jgi:hypothetical protein